MNLELKPISGKDDFERFCCEVAKDVFGDFLASRYGREGQKQHGIDIRATDVVGAYGRVVIQCKFNKSPDAKATLARAKAEFKNDCLTACTELRNDLDFDTFVYAGLWPADTSLDDQARTLAVQSGKTVCVWSLESLKGYVKAHARLQRLFARGVSEHGVLLLDHDFWVQAREEPADALASWGQVLQNNISCRFARPPRRSSLSTAFPAFPLSSLPTHQPHVAGLSCQAAVRC